MNHTDFAASERIWAEIDLDNLAHNFRQAQRLAGPAAVMPVVKADAYGHGAVQAARALFHAGARHFAVATAAEALELRRAGIDCLVLVMGGVPPAHVPGLARAGVSLAVADEEMAAAYAAALPPGQTLRVHIKIDTGMTRLGISAAVDAEEAARRTAGIASLPGFFAEGLFTHFAAADDEKEQPFTEGQIERFSRVDGALAKKGIQIPLKHCAASAAVIQYEKSRFDLVRPGIMLYGAAPDSRMEKRASLRSVMSWRAGIVQVKDIPAGETVSYGRTWRAGDSRTIAVVPAGYADGLPRCAGSRMDMLVRGRRAPQVGRICMDMCVLDVTGIPGVCPGDAATIIGRDGEEEITATELARAAGTISYEIFCAVGKRVPRIYLENGQVTERFCHTEIF